jgi:3',5'-cyclic-nucleotide phosphodiesterase
MESLRALVMEVSFPDDMLWLAKASGHHTPATLDEELRKLGGAAARRDLPVLLYHIKPHFQRQVERQLARLRKREFDVLALGDELIV